MVKSRRLMWIVWPAFFSACLLEALVFSLVDPQSLQWFGRPIELSRLGVYSAAFFAFWLISMVATGLTVLLAVPESGSLRNTALGLPGAAAPPGR